MIVAGPTAAEDKLFPSVLAIKGKTLMVSNAGKITTMPAAVRTTVNSQKGLVSGPRPIVNLAKFKLTEERVLAPKKDAADVPSNR